MRKERLQTTAQITESVEISLATCQWILAKDLNIHKEVETDQAIEEPTVIMHINQDSESEHQKSVTQETFELI
ncbi:hypothetical protein TNCV_4221921 [Trichonephila clavipes]|nr:hypothetical protein TNCV_4221921 [Trichonephila clavipes]